jgi:hypothetical protein
MGLSIKVDPIDRDVALIIDQDLSPAAQSRAFAAQANAFLADADAVNRRVLGRIPPSHTFVDGRENADLSSVKPDGIIVREYELIDDVLVFIGEELRAVSPVLSGQYRASHTLYADGVEVREGEQIPAAEEYVFLSAVPYARKIEGAGRRPPESKQAPRGVYEITSAKANARLGNIARAIFTWRAPYQGTLLTGHKANKSDGRVPAIVVTLGR